MKKWSELPAVITGTGLADWGLSAAETQAFQQGLWQLLAQQTRRYTSGESSSVRTEIAQELLQSICFSIAVYIQDTGDIEALKTDDLEALLKRSSAVLNAEVDRGKMLLCRVYETAPEIENQSYTDTLKGMGMFFKWYDSRYFAHQIPGDIDYQLCHPVPENLAGILFINEYLRRLQLENTFCNCFHTQTVIALLTQYCPDYVGQLINLFEPVAINAIGRVLLKKRALTLGITDTDRAALAAFFLQRTSTQALAALTNAADALCGQLHIKDKALAEYLRQCAAALYPRIQAQDSGLAGIFLPLVAPEK